MQYMISDQTSLLTKHWRLQAQCVFPLLIYKIQDVQVNHVSLRYSILWFSLSRQVWLQVKHAGDNATTATSMIYWLNTLNLDLEHWQATGDF